MKNYFKLFTILISCSLLFSCNRPDGNLLEEVNNTVEDYYMNATIDGVEFSTTKSTVSPAPDLTEVFSIIGEIEDDRSIIIVLESPTNEGTFSLPEESITLSYLSEGFPCIANQAGGSGTITISKNTSNFMEGTFSLIAICPIDNSELEVTEGNFKAQKF